MKKIERSSVNYLCLQILACVIIGVILWPLFDLFVCNVLTHTEFQYTYAEHIAKPALYGIIFGLVIWAIGRKNDAK